MDIVLGVSMTPTTVRMVLVEGEKADGVTVDHDVFDISSDDASATASEQVVTAILGTRESATEGGHRLVSTGVTWRDHDEAAALRDALAAHKIDDVMLVSELHAAGALAQAVGRAVGYDRTALMFLERDTATLAVVETTDGSIVKVQKQDLHTEDAVAELGAMVAGLGELDAPPQGVFVVGSGVSAAAIKLQLDSATSLPVSAPEEAELALARGAALASANAPLFEASTVGLGYAQDSAVTQMAGVGYMEAPAAPAALAYSEVNDEAVAGPEFEPVADATGARPVAAAQQGRKPFLLVGSALTSIFVIGVTALVISLAVSIRPTVDQRPNPGESVIVPTQEAPPPATPEAALPPAPAPPPETIPAPKPVVQEAPQPQAPRTVFVERPAPAPAAPAPAPAAPAPAAPAPIAPPVVAPAPVAPYTPPPIIVLPRPQLPPILRPWDPPRRDDDYDPPQQWPKPPQQRWPSPPQQQQPQQQWPQQQPQQQWPQQQPQQQWPQQQPQQQWPQPQQQSPPQQQWPQQQEQSGRGGSGSGSGSGDYGSGRGSGSGDSGSGSGGSSLWPWPSFGR